MYWSTRSVQRAARPLVVLGLLLGGSAWAVESAGIQLYARGAYAKAVRALTADAENPEAPESERALARVYLAASLLALQQDAQARQQLEQLARTYPAQQVDPAIFPPSLVAMDKAVRGELEAERRREEAERAERERLAAEAAAAERERLAAEAAAAERERLAAEAVPAVEEGPSFRLRPEAFGYASVLGNRSVGYGAGVSLGFKALDASVHVLPGSDSLLGFRGEVGFLFGQSPVQPRAALRVTRVQNAGLGGGGVVGLRITPTPRLTFMMDVGFEYFLVDKARYEPRVLTVSLGLGFNLL